MADDTSKAKGGRRSRSAQREEAESHQVDLFDVRIDTKDHVDVDERSAIFSILVACKEGSTLDELVATNVKLQVDRNSLPARVTIGPVGRVGVGQTDEESWSVIAALPDMSLHAGASRVWQGQFEVKTGFFAGVDIELKGKTAGARYAEMIADLEKYGPADEYFSGAVLRFRVTCEVGKPTTTKHYLYDPEPYNLVIRDRITEEPE